MKGGHEVVAFDRDEKAVATLKGEGATGAGSLEEAAKAMESPRAFWVMLPAGDPTESTVAALRKLASPGDVIIDGGNTFYKDDIRRGRRPQDERHLLRGRGHFRRRVGTGARLSA